PPRVSASSFSRRLLPPCETFCTIVATLVGKENVQELAFRVFPTFASQLKRFFFPSSLAPIPPIDSLFSLVLFPLGGSNHVETATQAQGAGVVIHLDSIYGRNQE